MTSKFIPPNPQAGMPRQRTPDLSLAQDIVCENCGNLTFEEVLLFKKVSALMTDTGKEGIVPIPTIACVACGYVNKMFRPPTGSNEETTPSPSENTEPERPKLVLED